MYRGSLQGGLPSHFSKMQTTEIASQAIDEFILHVQEVQSTMQSSFDEFVQLLRKTSAMAFVDNDTTRKKFTKEQLQNEQQRFNTSFSVIAQLLAGLQEDLTYVKNSTEKLRESTEEDVQRNIANMLNTSITSAIDKIDNIISRTASFVQTFLDLQEQIDSEIEFLKLENKQIAKLKHNLASYVLH
jgi:citrate synthase